MGLHTDSGCVEERRVPRGSLDDCTCAARAWHSAGRAARDAMADVYTGALAGTRRCRLLHNRGVDHARTRDIYTAFLIELQSRRVQVLGSTPYPDEAFVIQCLRSVSSESTLSYREGGSWSAIAIRSGIGRWSSGSLRRAFGPPTPPGAPNCNAHAERFVRSVKEECLHRVVPLGEWLLRRTLREFITHYHRERNHQALANELIDGPAVERRSGAVRRRRRVGRSSQLLLPVRRVDQSRDPCWDRTGFWSLRHVQAPSEARSMVDESRAIRATCARQ